MNRICRNILIKHTLTFAVLLAGTLLLYPSPADAHPFGGVYQTTSLYNMGTHLMVEYETHLGRDVLLTFQPDLDRDQVLSETEKEKLLSRLSKTLVPNLFASLNHKKVKIMEMDRSLKMADSTDLLKGINTYFILRIPFNHEENESLVFQFSDHNFLEGELDRLNYFHAILGVTGGARLLESGRGIEIVFSHSVKSGSAPQTPIQSMTLIGSGGENAITQSDLLSRYFTESHSGLKMLLFAVIGAFFIGAGHALSPGHGKAMVAAYLVGSKGRVSHAFFLGLIVTVTHVAVVVLLGLVALVLSDYFMPQDLFPWLSAISGGLIFLIGYWMLAKRALANHNHHHGNHDHHHHHPDAGQGGISFGSLLSMGVAGGMVPCPSALVVLLLSLSFSRVAEGLVLIFFFSFGLAAVLILVGILTVTASRFTDKFSEHRTWINNLPVFSAGLVMTIGMVVIVRALV